MIGKSESIDLGFCLSVEGIPAMNTVKLAVLICAESEWASVLANMEVSKFQDSPVGPWFSMEQNNEPIIFFHTGWGKVAAAAATQYVIDRWSPELLVNLGTCGGFAGKTEVGDVILVNETVIYDIVEQMGDPQTAIDHYSVDLDISFLPRSFLSTLKVNKMLSADRDIVSDDIESLKARFGGVAADWESGAVAFVARKNRTKLVILRGVTDLVGQNGSAAYSNIEYFKENANKVMQNLLRLVKSLSQLTLSH